MIHGKKGVASLSLGLLEVLETILENLEAVPQRISSYNRNIQKTQITVFSLDILIILKENLIKMKFPSFSPGDQ